MAEGKIPRAPASLGRHGKAWWRAVTTEWELGTTELDLLATICRLRDRVEQFDAIIVADGPLLDARPHPLLAQQRADRRLMHQLLAQLRLPDPDGVTLQTGYEARARAGNAARWSTERPVDEVAAHRRRRSGDASA